MIYEIINPSDKYTLETDDFALACIANCLLGEGAWGLESIDESGKYHKAMPLFIFGGVDEWFQSEFGKTFGELLEGVDMDSIATVLESVMIGEAEDRRSYQKALQLIDSPEKRKQWRDHWHNERRTSLNDIGARAWRIAESLRNRERSGMEPMLGTN